MFELQSDMNLEELNPTILYCSRVRETRIEEEHSHDNIEMAYILSGNGKYKIEGVIYEVKQGDVIICNPGVKHQSIVEDPENPTLEFVCGFTDVAFKGMKENMFESKDNDPILKCSLEVRREISRCCYDIIEENYSTLPGRQCIIKAQLVRILIQLYRTVIGDSSALQESNNFDSYSKNYVTNKIIDYLNENYAQKISLEKIANNMYLSPVYISRIFKEVTGESPINYLIKIRLAKAKELLEKDDSSNVKAIGTAVGYDDVYHFSKLFKKYYGISPLNYRKMSRFREM